MKRTTTEILRRGFESTVANWPLIAIRIAESVVLIGLTIGAIIAAIVPVVVAAGLGNFDFSRITDATDAFSMLVVEHWMLIVYILLIASVVLLLLVAIHAFVDGGTAQVLVDAERGAKLAAFNGERWLLGGRRAWWPIFWIYNIVWTIAGVIILIPLAATLAIMIVVSDTTGRVVVACAGLLLAFLVIMPIALLAAVWTEKAIAVCLMRNANATESLRVARRDIRSDLGRHFIVAFIMFVVTVGGSGVLGMMSTPFSLLHQNQPLLMVFTAPAQIVVSFAQTILSAATGMWFLAAYIALTGER